MASLSNVTSSRPMLKSIVLYGLASIYLIAFGSIYIQAPGLIGTSGLLPASHVLRASPSSLEDFLEQPSLLRFGWALGLDAEGLVDLACLLGVSLALLAVVLGGNMILFTLMWVLYLSITHVGQGLFSYDWDNLLLEMGFIAILLAPLNFYKMPSNNESDSIPMYLLKWLAFRVMFASGVVKLQTGDPEWWGLTAMNWHYSSQYLPSPGGWILHQAPEWFQTVTAALIHIFAWIVPFLYFFPTMALKRVGFVIHIILRATQAFSGNFGLLMFLEILLAFSVIDSPTPDANGKDKSSGKVSGLFTMFTLVTLFGACIYFFGFSIDLDTMQINSKINFSMDEFNAFVYYGVFVTMVLAAIGFLWTVVDAISRSVAQQGASNKVFHTLSTILITFACFDLFCLSLVPFSYLDERVENVLPDQFQDIHYKMAPFRLTHPYGMMKNMTGVGGRPEVILLGSNDGNQTWEEYEFRYKPSNPSTCPPIVAPHSPRLDWLMWSASQSEWNQNHWYIILVQRILTGEQDVLDLLQVNPFPGKPPKFVKANLYNYHFTKLGAKDWWTRELVGEYMYTYTAEATDLVDYLKQNEYLPQITRSDPETFLDSLLRMIRSSCAGLEGFMFVMALLVTTWLVRFTWSFMSRRKT